MRDPVCWTGRGRPYLHPVSVGPEWRWRCLAQPSSENRAYRGPRWAAAGASVSAGVVARSSQCSTAWVTVGAVGPNDQHVRHATNFGSRSLLIQRFELPQKGQGREGCTGPGKRSGPLSPGLWTIFVDPLPGFSEPIGPVQSVQFGINPLEKTLDFRALVGTGVFFKAAEQVLLLRQQLSNARHRRHNIVMLQHW
jgi:hypothetical protein